MSRTRVYSQDTLDVMERFFLAFEECRKNKLVPSIGDYFAGADIKPETFYRQRKERSRGYFEIGWAVPLIRDCGVSARWLLTGIGQMFAQ